MVPGLQLGRAMTIHTASQPASLSYPSAAVIRRKLTHEELIRDCAGHPIISKPVILQRSATEGPSYVFPADPTFTRNSGHLQGMIVPGLEDLLRELGLSAHIDDAQLWCRRSGAAFLEEVYENLSDLVESLNLSKLEQMRLLETPEKRFSSTKFANTSAPQTIKAAVDPKLLARGTTVNGPISSSAPFVGACPRTVSVPVTSFEQGAAMKHAAKAHVPLQAWQEVGHKLHPPASTSTVLQPTGSSSAVAITPEADLVCPEEQPQSHRQRIRSSGNFYRMRDWSPPRYRITRPEYLRAIRARIPSASELSALQDAQQRLAEASAPALPGAAVQENVDLSSSNNFESFQQGFMKHYGAQIKEELPGVELRPAPLAESVQRKFMSSLDSDVEVQAAYHGTSRRNFDPILSKGLLVPGHGGVSVAHGSAHGVGIYTAKLGASSLSRSFCDSDSFLVCAVADDATKKSTAAPEPAGAGQPGMAGRSAAAKWTGSGPCGSRHHRVTQKASSSTAPAFSQTRLLGNHELHRESCNVRHVGSAMVVFDESRVAPVFVASNIGFHGRPAVQQVQGIQQPWPSTGNPNLRGALPGGGFQTGSHQLAVGNERLWAPPEELKWKKGTELRRHIESKQRDVRRQAQRDAKSSGEALRA
eukprot:TRINITY_DN63230_c0_g1_i1.p1 TRINITY_DN63230_c0_g1~~TRINITY_DN63230_c0_g1_i1.p1  ORF type:complete len:645 (+),score=108.07 TRINITY_DN63230_c0_g1_i1:49-1983(+)